MRRYLPLSAALLLIAVSPPVPSAPGEEEIPNLPPPRRVHALTHARLVAAPGEVIEDATVVLRDGAVAAAGADVPVPPDARTWNLEGRTVYAGFIDLASGVGLPAAERRRGRGEEGERPRAEPAAGAAHPLAAVRPERRAADLVRLEDEEIRKWRQAGFTAVVTAPADGTFRGSAALLHLGGGGPGANLARPHAGQAVGMAASGGRAEYPGSAMGAVALIRQTLLDAAHYRLAWEAHRSDPGTVPRPEADNALEALGPLIDGKDLAFLDTVSLLGLVRAAAIVREHGLRAVAWGSGEEYRHPDWVREAGLPVVLPVAFPQVPEVGDDGPALDVSTAELRHWRLAPENPARLARAGIEFALTARGLDSPGEFLAKAREAVEAGLDPDLALAAVTQVPAQLLGLEGQLGVVRPGAAANLTVADGDLFRGPARVTAVWVDGVRYEAPPPGEEGRGGGKAEADGNGEDGASKRSARKKATAADGEQVPAEIPWAPAPGPLDSPPAVLVRNATLWTSAEAGTLLEADLLAQGGRIVAVGPGLDPPAGARTVDAAGRHVTPGLVDAHSHSATAEAVNESTRAVTAEVRVADVLDPDDPVLYRLLAGGLTVANVLHGSANPIGGQNAVIRVRTGRSPAGLLLDGAMPGIKLAMGENPKQANWGDRYTTRYPQTRMGVEQVIRQAFLAARDYRRRQGAPGGHPLRRDLQLEAIAEVLDGSRLVHAHCYRQDEILALLRLAEEFGVRIGILQHVLEGYKVGREIAAHGAGASTFSDWWAYKFEVYDAIPYNAALMWKDGVLVSLNSDSDELARRLNLEAAKAVRYGGLPPEEALRLVTSNPARQLRLDDRFGSLQPGGEADFVVWSGDPLSTGSVVEQTWVGGELYFDRFRDQELRDAAATEREALLRAARAAREKKPAGEADGGKRRRREVAR